MTFRNLERVIDEYNWSNAMSEITKHELEIDNLKRMIRVQEKAVDRATGSRKVEQEKILARLRAQLEKLTEI